MKVFRRNGNGLFIHTSKNFSIVEIEEHYNNPINPDAMKDGRKWKAPINEEHRVSCGSNPNEIHVLLTVNGEPFQRGSETVENDMDNIAEKLEELMLMLTLRDQAEREGITGNALLKRIVKNYFASKEN